MRLSALWEIIDGNSQNHILCSSLNLCCCHMGSSLRVDRVVPVWSTGKLVSFYFMTHCYISLLYQYLSALAEFSILKKRSF